MAKPITVAQSCYLWLPLTAIWLYRQVKFLPQEQITSHIVCEQTENLDHFPWLHLHTPPNDWRYLVDRLLRRLQIRHHLSFTTQTIKQEKIQILHSHFGNRGWIDMSALKSSATRNLKHVVTFYGHDVNRLPQQNPIWLERYKSLFASVDKVLCEGSFMANSIKQLGCPADKTIVHHLGIELESIEFMPRKRLRGEPLKVLMTASFVEKKGLPYGIEALGVINKHTPVELTIIGDIPTQAYQPEKEKILEALANNDLMSQTRLLGYQPQSVMFAEAYKHHLFLSPSVTASDGNTEGGAPVSLIDMSATGMPIVSTTHCDIPEVVVHGRAGLLAPERDIDTLVQHLTWFIDHPEKWGEMGAFARQHIEKEYNARIQGQRLAQIYTSLI